MKTSLRVCCAFLMAILLLTALSGCGEVNKGLLKKSTTALADLETFESGGFRQDFYLSSTDALTQSRETWFLATDVGVDWYMQSRTYGEDGALQMESSTACRDGVLYGRYSTADGEGIWKKSDQAAPSGAVGFPKIDYLDKGEDYEYFRMEEDGRMAFAYSQSGLAAFHAQMVEKVTDSIPAEIDDPQYTEEQRAALEKQYAHIIAAAEQTPITDLSGSVVLDESGALLCHQMQYSVENPKLEQDGGDGWVAASAETASMRFVTEILTHSDAEVEQKLAALLAEVPK